MTFRSEAEAAFVSLFESFNGDEFDLSECNEMALRTLLTIDSGEKPLKRKRIVGIQAAIRPRHCSTRSQYCMPVITTERRLVVAFIQERGIRTDLIVSRVESDYGNVSADLKYQ